MCGTVCPGAVDISLPTALHSVLQAGVGTASIGTVGGAPPVPGLERTREQNREPQAKWQHRLLCVTAQQPTRACLCPLNGDLSGQPGLVGSKAGAAG